MAELHTWRALYSDQSYLDEQDAAQGFASVDQAQVQSLALIDSKEEKAAHVVDIPESAKAVFFRRRGMTLNITDESVTNRTTAHCIGWQTDTSAVYLFVFEDGSTLLTNDRQAV